MSAGTSFLFTFPFWIFVDCEDPPDTRDYVVADGLIRFYPPFRSGRPNFLPMPYPMLTRVPFAPGTRPRIDEGYSLQELAAVPQLRAADGDISIMLVLGDEFEEDPNPFPMDSLRLDVVAPRKVAERLSADVTEKLMAQLRILSKQWWIGHSIHPLAGYLRQSFPVKSSGELLELPEARAQARTVRGDEMSVNRRIWTEATRAVSEGREVPLYQEILLDGAYFAATRDWRRAIIELGIACEHAKDVTLQRLWENRNPGRAYRRGRLVTGYDLPDQLDGQLSERFGYSFRQHDEVAFSSLMDLWDARGNVAHGAEAVYRFDGKRMAVGEEECKRFARAAETCITWLEGLE